MDARSIGLFSSGQSEVVKAGVDNSSSNDSGTEASSCNRDFHVSSEVLTAEEKKRRRVMANRKSAKESRERRKQLLANLEASVDVLSKENASLQNENDELRKQLAELLPQANQILQEDNQINLSQPQTQNTMSALQQMGADTNQNNSLLLQQQIQQQQQLLNALAQQYAKNQQDLLFETSLTNDHEYK